VAEPLGDHTEDDNAMVNAAPPSPVCPGDILLRDLMEPLGSSRTALAKTIQRHRRDAPSTSTKGRRRPCALTAGTASRLSQYCGQSGHQGRQMRQALGGLCRRAALDGEDDVARALAAHDLDDPFPV